MLSLKPTDALLVIDMQSDFLPGGALAVADGDAILPGINALSRQFEHVILTQDWHPAGHISFASAHPGKNPFVDSVDAPYGRQTLWPDHCVQGSPGAELAPDLRIPHAELILRKGFRQGIDSYSAFEENDKATPTGLAGYLRERGFKRLFFCGLAYDFCVGFSALDAVRLGFAAIVMKDLSRAVGLPAAGHAKRSIEHIEGCFATEGVGRVSSSDLTGNHGAER